MRSEGLTDKDELERTQETQRQTKSEQDPRAQLARTLSAAAEAAIDGRFQLGDADPQAVSASWFKELTSWESDDAAPFAISWGEE